MDLLRRDDQGDTSGHPRLQTQGKVRAFVRIRVLSGCDDEAFAIRFMHEFLLLVILAGIVPIAMNAMVSIKKPRNGIIISMSKQLVLIALLLILPRIFGIDGVLLSGPIADFMVAVAAFVVIRKAFRELDSLPAA